MKKFKIYAGLKSLDGAVYRETKEAVNEYAATSYAIALACMDFEEHFDQIYNYNDIYKEADSTIEPKLLFTDLEEYDRQLEELVYIIKDKLRGKELVYYVDEL